MSLPPASREPHAVASDTQFGQTLYRFLFFDWLFRDVSATRDLYERHAAREHNRRMSRYLPVYMRRWSLLAGIDFALEGGAVEVRGIVKDIGGGTIPGAEVWVSSRNDASDRAIVPASVRARIITS